MKRLQLRNSREHRHTLDGLLKIVECYTELYLPLYPWYLGASKMLEW